MVLAHFLGIGSPIFDNLGKMPGGGCVVSKELWESFRRPLYTLEPRICNKKCPTLVKSAAQQKRNNFEFNRGPCGHEDPKHRTCKVQTSLKCKFNKNAKFAFELPKALWARGTQLQDCQQARATQKPSRKGPQQRLSGDFLINLR